MIKRILLAFGAGLILLVGVVLFRTFTFQSRQVAIDAVPAPEITPDALQHFIKAITYKTVSNSDSLLFDSLQFIGFRDFLEETYPRVHQQLKREVVAGYSLLYTWEGKNKELNPVVLLAHQDVVPVEPGTESLWTVDPFAGTVKDDFIWGRGTADDKINVIGILEAAEKLLSENFQPKRTIYFGFSHDEELDHKGAIAIASLLKSRNIKAELVLDEGTIITKKEVPGMQKPVALIATAEKGFLLLKLTVEKDGGHSSMPEKETAIDILARGIARLRDFKFEPRFAPSTLDFAEAVGPELPFTQRMAFANLWLFKPMVYNVYEQSKGGNALIRTTIAPTIIESGVKENVIPSVAHAIVNFRMLPGHHSTEVIETVKKVLNDERIHLEVYGHLNEATETTSSDSYAYRTVERTIRKSYDGIVPTPMLMLGATDSRYFSDVSDGIIKFSPMIDPIGFHGIDERASLESYRTTLWFFEQLMRDLE